MQYPEMPPDPITDNELVTNKRMRKMMLFGVSRGILELLIENDHDEAVIQLAYLCEQKRLQDTPEAFIDEFAIGFVQPLDQAIYEDALVVQEILRPEMGTTIY